jgi:hypothetical protein
MTFIVNVKTMVNGMALEVGHKPCNVDDGHVATLPCGGDDPGFHP